jgi:alkylated DNA repair protein (DNA oxidative demethylase)
MARMRGIVEEPDGLVYRPDFLTAEEESALLAEIEAIDFQPVVMHGQAARRTVRHYGYDYDYERYGRIMPIEPLPPWLQALRDSAAAIAGLAPARLVQALVTRYPAGATIGWHRDAPMFGEQIVGVSLLGTARMQFQRGKGEERRVYEVELPPRSAYVLGGEARSRWQHGIPATKELRYSVTFRSVADPGRWSG